MPTVLRVDGFRVVIYLNDHSPAHVHVLGAGGSVVVDLHGPEVREVIDCDRRITRRALEIVAEHREALMVEWEKIHG